MSKAAETVPAAWWLETRVSSPGERLRVHVIPRDLSAGNGRTVSPCI